MPDDIIIIDELNDQLTITDNKGDAITISESAGDNVTVMDSLGNILQVTDTKEASLTINEIAADSITIKEQAGDQIYISDIAMQGPKGDSGQDAIIYFSAQNKDSVTIVKGSPVTQHSSGSGVERTNASVPTKYCIGFSSVDIAPGFSGNIQTDGVVNLPDWTNVAGTPTLAIKAKYYLDTQAGKITNNPPSVAGQIIQQVGYAIDSQTLVIKIGYAILL